MPEVRPLGAGTEHPAALLVGCGGAGCNTLRFVPAVSGLDILAVNDFPRPSLQGIRRRLFLNKAGLREIAAMDSRAIRTLATTSEQAVAVELGDAEFVVPIAGLGGEMGSWSANLVARVAALKRATTMAVVTTPFSAEGVTRRAVAGEAAKLLRTHAHGVLTVPNDALLRVAPHLPFLRAFEVASRVAVQPVLDLLRVVTRTDLPLLQSTLRAASEWQPGMGEGTRDHPEIGAVDAAARSPWLTSTPSQSRQAIVFIGMREPDEASCREVVHEVNLRTPSASVLWGAFTDPEIETVRVTVLFGF